MNPYDAVRLSLYSHYGAVNNVLRDIPDNYYNKLRYMYYEGLPVSFYILFKSISNLRTVERCILFTKVFGKESDYRIVIADTNIMGKHAFIECDDEVFDISLNKMIKKDYYYKMFKIKDGIYTSKEEIENFLKSNFLEDNLEDSYKVPMILLEKIKKIHEKYKGKNKELIDRQVNSFFHDINYNDDMMIIDINKIRN